MGRRLPGALDFSIFTSAVLSSAFPPAWRRTSHDGSMHVCPQKGHVVFVRTWKDIETSRFAKSLRLCAHTLFKLHCPGSSKCHSDHSVWVPVSSTEAGGGAVWGPKVSLLLPISTREDQRTVSLWTDEPRSRIARPPSALRSRSARPCGG